jgi:Uma2 family endonuclease
VGNIVDLAKEVVFHHAGLGPKADQVSGIWYNDAIHREEKTMATALTEPEKSAALEPRQCITLSGLNWATYRKISDALSDHHVRLTFNRGVLELMTKSRLHEVLSRLYNGFLVVLADEYEMPLSSCGGMTCDREDLERGAEPDECFYLVNEPVIRGKDQIDLTKDPPPDLMVEIDLTSSSKARMTIYAAIKVPEVWRIDAASVTVFQLSQNGSYLPADQSIYFPGLPVSGIAGFAQRLADVDQITVFREFRIWVRKCIAGIQA